MADNDVADAVRQQHRRRHFAGERALVLVVHVLRAEQNRRSCQRLRHVRDQDVSRRDQDVAILRQRRGVGIEFGANTGNERARLDRHKVHLPVRRDQFFAHVRSFSDQTSSALTPGSSRPSRNSRVAPPPVEICVNLPAHGACATAAAVSPPPIIETTPIWLASASPTRLVPPAKAGISKNPSGPFQITVLARSISAINAAAVCGPMSRPIISDGISLTVCAVASPSGLPATI